MPIIYIDVLFAVNLIINYVLLKTTCVFVTLKETRLRIAVGAFVGALYAVLIFFPDFSLLYTSIFKFMISMLIIATAFPFYSFRSYIKAVIVFYLVSFAFGGCVLGVFYFSDIGSRIGAVYSNGILYFNFPWTVLLVSVLLFRISVKIFNVVSKKYYTTHSMKKKLLLYYDGKTAEVTALLDTGNSLIDPVSLSPVVVAEYKSIKTLFSSDIQGEFERLNTENITWVISEMVYKGLPVRLIPFSSLGNENGMLIGFSPDKAQIQDEYGVRTLNKCVVGIYEKTLTKDRSYGALLNPYLQ